MKAKRRWLQAVLEESAKESVAMPWARKNRVTRSTVQKPQARIASR